MSTSVFPRSTSSTTSPTTNVTPALREQGSSERLRYAGGGGGGPGNATDRDDSSSGLKRPLRSATAPQLGTPMDDGYHERSSSRSGQHSTSISSLDSNGTSGTYTTASTNLTSPTTNHGNVRSTTPPLFHVPSTYPSFHSYLLTWTTPQITQFLALHRCLDHAQAFEAHHITGAVVLELGADELKEIGVTKVGDRVRLLGGIRELRRRCFGGGNYLAPGWNVGRGGGLQAWNGVHPMARSESRLGRPSPVTASSLDSEFGSGSAGGIEFRLNGTSTVSSAGVPVDGVSPHPFAAAGSTTTPMSPDDDAGNLDRSRQGGPMRRLNARPPPLHLEQTSLMSSSADGGVLDRSAGSTGTDGSGTSGTSRQRSGVNVGPSVVIPSNIVGGAGAAPASARSASSLGSAGLPGTGESGSFAPSESNHSADTTASSASNYSNDTVRGGGGSSGSLHGQQAGMGGVPGPSTRTATSRIRSPAGVTTDNIQTPPQTQAGFGRRSPSPALISGPAAVDVSSYLARPLPPAPPGHDDVQQRVRAPTPSPDARSPGGQASTHRSKSNISPTKSKLFSRSGSTGANASTHPYAGPSVFGSPPVRSHLTPQSGTGQGSPTRDGFTGASDDLQAPVLLAQDGNESSPSREAFHGGLTTPTMPESAANAQRSPYSSSGDPDVPMTARLRTGSNEAAISPSMSLDDVRRRTVKFINGEDGTSRVINIEDCEGGVEVLEKALRKFGKWRAGHGAGAALDSESDGDADGSALLELDGWNVFLEGDDAPISETDVLAICQAPPDDPSRDRGLTIRRNRKLTNRKNIEGFFGEVPPLPMSPKSPTYFPGPRLGNAVMTRSPQKNGATKKMNRASTVSIMSGLGVPMSNVVSPGRAQSQSSERRVNLAPTQPAASTARTSPTATSFLANRGKKMYNFFGHRPPSELIASHLADYFPSAKRKELERTARNSMIRLSTHGSDPADGLARMQSRFSVASSIDSSSQAGRVPRLSVSAGGVAEAGNDEAAHGSAVSQRPPLLPALVPEAESFSDSLKVFSPKLGRPPSIAISRRGSGGSTRSRLSTLSQFRRARRKSDAASMLTVDEITAEVERRRASVITFAESEDGEMDDEAEEDEATYARRISAGLTPGLVPQGEDEDDNVFEEDESDEDESSEEEEEEEEEEPSDEEGKKYTSTGSKRSIKWIKGALLGAGSFGQVFLGLDAQSGLFMAVKQVELGEGGGHGEARRKGMIVALEREIELLKDLQHEHIVQYLDSSTDAHHLNIFLEYVPGGTVASLLNKYGPFEEALVQRWIKQTLTGLEYLHQRDIIHRDIKGANILVDNKGGIKIADFGISKKIENNLLSTRIKSTAGPGGRGGSRQSLQGSVFWMAPEVVKQTSYTKKADIWSVGCLVVEMLTGSRPWPDLTQMQALFRIGSSAKPSIPGDISADAVDFLTRTFEIDHTKRPHASELLMHPFIVDQ